MENVIQVQGITKEDLFKAFQRLESKINDLQQGTKKPSRYSVKELADHCGVAELTVRNWITEGKVKADRIGRRIFISEEEFQKALSEVKSLKYQRA